MKWALSSAIVITLFAWAFIVYVKHRIKEHQHDNDTP